MFVPCEYLRFEIKWGTYLDHTLPTMNVEPTFERLCLPTLHIKKSSSHTYCMSKLKTFCSLLSYVIFVCWDGFTFIFWWPMWTWLASWLTEMDMVFVLYDKTCWFVVHGCLGCDELRVFKVYMVCHLMWVNKEEKMSKEKGETKCWRSSFFAYPTNKRESKRKRAVGCFRFNHTEVMESLTTETSTSHMKHIN